MSEIIVDLLIAQRDNPKTAIIDDGSAITYREMFERCQTLAAWIDEIDPSGSNVALFLPNSAAFVVAYFAAQIAGRVVVPIHPSAGSAELASTLNYCDVVVVLTDAAGAAALEKIPLFEEVLVVTRAFTALTLGSSRSGLRGRGASLGEPHQPDAVSVLLHTSGTAGHPKRVMLTHQALLANIRAVVSAHGFLTSDVSLISLPMTFGYCHTAQMLTHVALGATLAILPAPFWPARFCASVEEYSVTNYTAVPANLLMLGTYRDFAAHNLTSLRTVCFGGAPISPLVLDGITALLPNVEFVQTYGQTEAGPRITALSSVNAKRYPRSVGIPIPGMALSVNLPEGPAPPDVIGEVVVTGPSLMRGYYKRPDATRRVLRDGALWTGDLGFLHDGFLHLVGRISNVITSGAVNIYPEEIEECLRAAPGVLEARVYPLPDRMLGEVPVVDLVLVNGADLDLVRGYARAQLAEYKVPRRFKRVDTLAKTTTGKMRRTTSAISSADLVATGGVAVHANVVCAGRDASLAITLATLLGYEPPPERITRRCPNCSSDAHGPPALNNDPGLRLSVSHHADLMVLAASRVGDVGVDVAPIRAKEGFNAIAARFFAPDEKALVLEADDPEFAFQRLWTRKEACVKAFGVGVLHPLASFTTVEDRVKMTVNGKVRTLHLTTFVLGDDAIASVASSCRAPVALFASEPR